MITISGTFMTQQEYDTIKEEHPDFARLLNQCNKCGMVFSSDWKHTDEECLLHQIHNN
jgi:hypothetical protein